MTTGVGSETGVGVGTGATAEAGGAGSTTLGLLLCVSVTSHVVPSARKYDADQK